VGAIQNSGTIQNGTISNNTLVGFLNNNNGSIVGGTLSNNTIVGGVIADNINIQSSNWHPKLNFIGTGEHYGLIGFSNSNSSTKALIYASGNQDALILDTAEASAGLMINSYSNPLAQFRNTSSSLGNSQMYNSNYTCSVNGNLSVKGDLIISDGLNNQLMKVTSRDSALLPSRKVAELYLGYNETTSGNTLVDNASIFLAGGAGDSAYIDCVIESRKYGGNEQSELLLFKGNDRNNPNNGPDQIRLRAGRIVLDTYSFGDNTSDRTATKPRLTVDDTGLVSISNIGADNFLECLTALGPNNTGVGRATQISIGVNGENKADLRYRYQTGASGANSFGISFSGVPVDILSVTRGGNTRIQGTTSPGSGYVSQLNFDNGTNNGYAGLSIVHPDYGTTNFLNNSQNPFTVISNNNTVFQIEKYGGVVSVGDFEVKDLSNNQRLKVTTDRVTIGPGSGSGTLSALSIKSGYKGSTLTQGYVTYDVPYEGTHFFWDNVEIHNRLFINTPTNPLFNYSGLINMNITGNSAGINIKQNTSTLNSINIWTVGNDSHNAIYFYQGNTQTERGAINVDSNGVRVSSASDYRLKENISLLADNTCLTDICNLPLYEFNFKNSITKIKGFLAHELQEIVPYSVTGEKNATDSNGNPKYQMIDKTELIPLLVGSVQELKKKLDDLQLKLDLLTQSTN
jgi:hypothetical protein